MSTSRAPTRISIARAFLNQVAKVRAEKFLLYRFGMVGEARLESSDRIASTFRMRIVGGGQIEPIARLADQFADILKWVRRKAQLIVHLFGGTPLHLA